MPSNPPHPRTKMKERPLIFTGESVRAILAGRKTQTRRVITHGNVFRFTRGGDLNKEERRAVYAGAFHWEKDNPAHPKMDQLLTCCPYGVPGDRLWVRETWAKESDGTNCPDDAGTLYRATDPGWDDNATGLRWRSPIHMPRVRSRLLLEVTAVRVERLQSITGEDAQREGISAECGGCVGSRRECSHRHDLPGGGCGVFMASQRAGYWTLWDRINGKRHPWSSNPFVWVVEFKRLS